MSKEELLKLIDSINIEEIDSITINYYIEKEPTSFYGYSNERKLKTISYGCDINKKLEYIRRDMESAVERIQQNNYYTLEEMVNQKLGDINE